MNLYLIPTIKLNSLLEINYLCTTFSFGYNPLQALHNAKVTLLSFGIEETYHLSPKCESYKWIPEHTIKNRKIIPQEPVHNDYINNILERIYTNEKDESDNVSDLSNKDNTSTDQKEGEVMSYFDLDWKDYTNKLAQLTLDECWSNKTYPDNGILTNYIAKTYERLHSERKIVFGTNYALFNTGLYTKYYEEIYAYQTRSDILFLTAYELSSLGITERPERADYFNKPELLIFDWHYPIDIQYKHILDDERNKERLPKEFLQSNNMINILNGAIETMKKRVSCNYRLAIPQYYDGKIQLLLPLCLMSDSKPDVAIAVTRKENCYQGHTCLTLEMAYNNARVITKPESNWLSDINIYYTPTTEY